MELGVAADRAYGDWKEMLAVSGAGGPDRAGDGGDAELHPYEISKAFLSRINVLCEKPMTVTEAEAEDLVLTARRRGDLRGELWLHGLCAGAAHAGDGEARRHRQGAAGGGGCLRMGTTPNAADADNPRVRWRYDRRSGGFGAVRGLWYPCVAHGKFRDRARGCAAFFRLCFMFAKPRAGG